MRGSGSTIHPPFCPNKAVRAELIDRIVDEVNDVLVANIDKRKARAHLHAKGTGPVLDKLVVPARQSLNLPLSTGGDIGGDLEAVVDDGRSGVSHPIEG